VCFQPMSHRQDADATHRVARMVLRAGPLLLSCDASPECLDRAHRDKILPKTSWPTRS